MAKKRDQLPHHGNGIIPTKFKYKVSGFSGERQAKLKIRDSCGNYEFVTATGRRPPPSPTPI